MKYYFLICLKLKDIICIFINSIISNNMSFSTMLDPKNIEKQFDKDVIDFTKESKKTLYIAIDVEKKGASFAHPVIQLGVAYGYNIHYKIKTENFCFDYKNSPFEKRCYDEFWVNHLDILKRIEENAKEPGAEWERFNKWLLDMEKENGTIKFVSDNPGYDIEAVDYHLHTEIGRLPMRYSSTGKYRSISDPSEQIKGLRKNTRNGINEQANKLVTHDHWAPNDASHHLIKYFLIRKVIDEMDSIDE